MIFIDSNIPMYLVGADHPNKPVARQLLERAVLAGERLMTSAEVYQEILHRYVAIDRRDAIAPAHALLDSTVDEVADITHVDVQAARDIVTRNTDLSARDALHVAVIHRLGCRRIMSFDAGFDLVDGLERVAG